MPRHPLFICEAGLLLGFSRLGGRCRGCRRSGRGRRRSGRGSFRLLLDALLLALGLVASFFAAAGLAVSTSFRAAGAAAGATAGVAGVAGLAASTAGLAGVAGVAGAAAPWAKAAVPKAAATVRAMIFFSILNLLDVGLVVLLGGFSFRPCSNQRGRRRRGSQEKGNAL